MASTKETIKSKLTCVSVCVGTDETDSEMGEWWDRKDHPLLNDVILRTLFEFMSGEDLKECRLVCQKWCELTLPSARTKFRVQLNLNGVDDRMNVTNFVEAFRKNKLGIPFDKYDLNPFCTTEGPGQEFLQICGNTAKKVSVLGQGLPIEVEDISELLKAMLNIDIFIIFCPIHSGSGNAVKLFPDDSSKPTLTFLKKLYVYDLDADRTSYYCPTFFDELLSVAPNISDFKVRDLVFDSDQNRIGQVLNAIEKLGRESVVEHLHFINASSEHFESLRRLAENGLQLKKLIFNLNRKREDVDSFEFLPPLATLFKNSIEHLYVDHICSSFVQFPHMPNINSLAFFVSGDFDSKFVNLKKLCPVLTELDLHYWEYRDGDDLEWEELLPNCEPCPNLNSLSLGNVVMRSRLFHHILNIFPKLTKLELDVKTDGGPILRRVMTEMTQLQDLSVGGMIEGIENIDAFYTGIPVQIVQALEQIVKELKEMSVQLRADTIHYYRTRYCQLPSIGSLTNLKRLRLTTTGRSEDDDEGEDEPRKITRMTDVFAYFGLYSMKHINSLEIEDCEFTKACSKILTTEMELDTWTIKDADDRDIIPELV